MPNVPEPWQAVILALGVYRLARLVGWDDFPPVQRLRDSVTGAQWNATDAGEQIADGEPDCIWAYRRPLLAHFFACPFCTGWWLSLAAYGAWLLSAEWTVAVLFPFALAAAVGLVAKNLDP